MREVVVQSNFLSPEIPHSLKWSLIESMWCSQIQLWIRKYKVLLPYKRSHNVAPGYMEHKLFSVSSQFSAMLTKRRHCGAFDRFPSPTTEKPQLILVSVGTELPWLWVLLHSGLQKLSFGLWLKCYKICEPVVKKRHKSVIRFAFFPTNSC